MIGILIGLAIHSRTTLIRPPRDRISFCQALEKIPEDATQEQLRALLGPPDDVWTSKEKWIWNQNGERENWCYGSHGHMSLPTLGQIMFEKGRFFYLVGYPMVPPPPLTVINQNELAKHLRVMDHPGRGPLFGEDPLYLIRAANDLRSLGKEKILAVLAEYGRIAPDDDKRAYWLSRTLFKPGDPPGYFAIATLGATVPPLPGDLRTWPDSPMSIVDDIPFTIFFGSSGGGVPEPVGAYLARASTGDWKLREEPLRPPDDPFPFLVKVIQSRHWPYPDDAKKWRLIVQSPEPRSESIILAQLLNLVRNAWWSPLLDTEWGLGLLDGTEFERFHQAFLATHPHWDAKRQMYVRGDGSFTPDHFSLPRR